MKVPPIVGAGVHADEAFEATDCEDVYTVGPDIGPALIYSTLPIVVAGG
jgi:hypothetical protein